MPEVELDGTHDIQNVEIPSDRVPQYVIIERLKWRAGLLFWVAFLTPMVMLFFESTRSLLASSNHWYVPLLASIVAFYCTVASPKLLPHRLLIANAWAASVAVLIGFMGGGEHASEASRCVIFTYTFGYLMAGSAIGSWFAATLVNPKSNVTV